MKTETYINRIGWPEGPWDRESADAIEWVHENGLRCYMRRNCFGAWCGYVVPGDGSKFAGMDSYEADELLGDSRPHGCVTFSGINQHLDGQWAIGFDCSHSMDGYPIGISYGIYRDQRYVTDQVNALAEAIAEIERHERETLSNIIEEGDQ